MEKTIYHTSHKNAPFCFFAVSLPNQGLSFGEFLHTYISVNFFIISIYHFTRWHGSGSGSVLRTTLQVKGKVKNRPPFLQKPMTDRHLNLHGWLRRGLLPMQNFITIRLPPFAPKYAKMRIKCDSASFLFLPSAYIQPRPVHRFLRSIRQIMSFSVRMCLLWARKQKFCISGQFTPPPTQTFCQFLTGLFASNRH